MSKINVEHLRELAQEAREDYEPEDLVVTFERAADEIERLRRVEQVLKLTVIGWREWDWPEGFDRRTAGIIADAANKQLAVLKGE